MNKPTHVWIFDSNRRVYRKPDVPTSGFAIGGPIYREHWWRQAITGETRVSWITEFGRKVPKRGGRGVCFTEFEVELDCWAHAHSYLIRDRVRALPAAQLAAVAKLIGYEPAAPSEGGAP